MEGKSHNNVRGSDVFEHINYLYQLSHFHVKQNPRLSAYYLKEMIAITKKAVLRLDPRIKRTICKGCYMLLIPGLTVKVRHRKKSKIIWTCMYCGTLKRFPANNSNYKIWSECPDASIEIL